MRWLACVIASALLSLSCGSDQNQDGVVDLKDLAFFSLFYMGVTSDTVNWCEWLESDDYWLQFETFYELFGFVHVHFECGSLNVKNSNDYPTRVAWSADGRLFASNAKIGSVFVYERQPGLTVVAEYKNLARPLGVALDDSGFLYVGVDRRDQVEVFDSSGRRVRKIGEGSIQMPNDLAFDADWNLYVVDSRSKKVHVYDREGNLLRSFGQDDLSFPVALAISGQEVFVADQRSSQIKVFDLQGNLVRSFGGFVTQGSLGYSWKGKFVHLQSLGVDSTGRLHALDAQQGLIEVLDATTGSFITSYGTHGAGPGELILPLDISINEYDETAVSDVENRRIEILSVP